MKKKIFNAFIIATPLVMLIILIAKYGLKSLVTQISQMHPFWLFFCLVLIFLYWFFESMALHVITNFFNHKMKRKESFSVTMVGQFFNAVTPFATGGQPAQVVYLHNRGIDLGNATAIVMLKFFVYQSVLTIYSLVIILISFGDFVTKIPLLFTMTFLGLAVHASMIIFTILFTYNKVLTEKIILFIFKILKKIKIVKGEESAMKKLEETLAIFHDNAGILRKNPKLLFKTSLFIFLELTALFAIPFFIALGFNIRGDFWSMFAAAVFVATAISIVPLPGSTGGAEGVFYLFFNSYFGDKYIITAIIVWRLITYYLNIAFGGLYSVLPNRKSKNKIKV